ncbi:MAG: hypothetical protein JWP11_1312 [Frankiales bacterium]|nr:hypothetical protein [Frankiales bacterium]
MATTEKIRISGRQGITMELALYVLDCANCGVVFGITEDYEKRRRRDGDNFTCPNGHNNAWCKDELDRERAARRAEEKRAEQLSQELAAANTRALRERERREASDRQAAAYKGVATKAKKRAAAALCPCCKRSFVQLRRHLEAKHPDYTGEIA